MAMPHATAVDSAEAEQDDVLIQQVLDPENTSMNFNRDLDPGEKADDAVNFSDLSDDDLADDEDNTQNLPARDVARTADLDESMDDHGSTLQHEYFQEQARADDGNGDTLDDLFGMEIPSPGDDGNAADDHRQHQRTAGTSTPLDSSNALDSDVARRTPAFAKLPHINTGTPDIYQQLRSRAEPDDGALSKEQQLQQELFAMSGSSLGRINLAPVIESQEDLLAALWPGFEPNKVPRFMDLLPPKKARYIGKTPLRRPKPVQPTRLSLEIAMDQEKSFRLALGSNKRFQNEFERQGLVMIDREPLQGEREEDEEDIESDHDYDPVGDLSWQDLQIVCEDWEFENITESPSPGPQDRAPIEQDDTFSDLVEDLNRHFESPVSKV